MKSKNFKKIVNIVTSLICVQIICSYNCINTNAAGNPVLSLKTNGCSTYTATAGEKIYLSYEVSGAGEWSTSGIHINYDSRLIPDGDGSKSIYYSNGEAVSDNISIRVYHRTGKEIHDTIPPENSDVPDLSQYVSQNQNCIFVTTFSSQNSGKDGLIIGVNMTVPEDAQIGDEYECNLWTLPTDQFTNCEKDMSMQEYAFNNLQNCIIKVGASPTLKGDANNNGELDISDVVTIAAYVGNSEKNTLSEQGIANADVHSHGDGITAGDALKIQQYLAGIIDNLD